MSPRMSPPSHGPARRNGPTHLRHHRPRRGIAIVLLAALLALPAGTLEGRAAAIAAGSSTVHVRVQGHIVALAAGQIKVRDRRGAVHTVLLTPATTYWHKLERKSFSDLRMAMRVYVLGLPASSGVVTALKVHIYYPTAHKTRAKKRRATP